MKIILPLLFNLIFNLPHAEARKVKLKIYDKISFIKHALMLKAVRNNRTVTFEWSEPHTDFSYFLEIYREGKNRPIGTVPVSGRKKSLKFKKEKKRLYWRVFARSRHGNVTTNPKKFPLP